MARERSAEECLRILKLEIWKNAEKSILDNISEEEEEAMYTNVYSQWAGENSFHMTSKELEKYINSLDISLTVTEQKKMFGVLDKDQFFTIQPTEFSSTMKKIPLVMGSVKKAFNKLAVIKVDDISNNDELKKRATNAELSFAEFAQICNEISYGSENNKAFRATLDSLGK